MARVETSARKTILCINYEEQKYLDITYSIIEC